MADAITAPRLLCRLCREWLDEDQFHRDNREKAKHRNYRDYRCKLCRLETRGPEHARYRERKRRAAFQREAWQWFEFGSEGILNDLSGESTDGVDLSPVRDTEPKKQPKRRRDHQPSLFEARG